MYFQFHAFWNIWNIPIVPPYFLDSRVMTYAAESHALGFDPILNNPQNPSGENSNYPRIWHLLFLLDIDRSHAAIIGSVFIILFLVGLLSFLFSKKFDTLTSYFLAILIFSPPVMLAIERANNELVVFFLIAIALSINYSSSITALFLLFFAAVLKLYPVFGFVYLLKETKKKFLSLFIPALSFFIIYVLFNLVDIKQIHANTPRFAKSSYGINVIWKGLTHKRILDLEVSDEIIMTVRILSYIVALLIIITALIFSLKNYDTSRYKHGEYLDAFRVGAAIYICSFILLNNFDYRLMFLIFTVPQLVSWIHKKEKRNSSLLIAITLYAIIFSFWNFDIKLILGMKLGFVLEEISNWIVFSCLLYLFLASVPDWFNDYLRRPFSLVKRFKSQSITS